MNAPDQQAAWSMLSARTIERSKTRPIVGAGTRLLVVFGRGAPGVVAASCLAAADLYFLPTMFMTVLRADEFGRAVGSTAHSMEAVLRNTGGSGCLVSLSTA